MGYGNEEEIATKYMEIHIIELKKFQKKNPDAKTKINQWLWLLAGKEEKVKMAEKENKEVKKAVEILDEVSMDKKERERYEAVLKAEFNRKVSMYNMKEEGEKIGIEKGIEKGKKEKQLEIAKKMLEKNISIEEIKDITGLDIEEIERIQKKN